MHGKTADSIFYSFIAVFLTVLFFYMPETVTGSVTSSLSVCAARVVPAVFPFSVLSAFFIKSGGADMADRIFSFPFFKIFGLEHGASALICGLFFGFPLGASAVGELYKKGVLTKKDASRLLTFCACASPTFSVFSVGAGLFGNIKVGVFIWATQFSVSILIGVVSGVFSRKNKRIKFQKNDILPTENSFPELFTSSVKDASSVMINVCGAVIFFSLLGNIASEIIFGISQNIYLRLFTLSFFEFATGASSAADAFLSGEITMGEALAFSGFSIGFSGLSVICQNASVVSREINLLPHIAAKFFCGMISGIIIYILVFSGIISESVSVSTDGNFFAVSRSSLLPTVFFICLYGICEIKNKIILAKNQKK